MSERCDVVGYPECGRRICELEKGHVGYHQSGNDLWLGYATPAPRIDQDADEQDGLQPLPAPPPEREQTEPLNWTELTSKLFDALDMGGFRWKNSLSSQGKRSMVKEVKSILEPILSAKQTERGLRAARRTLTIEQVEIAFNESEWGMRTGALQRFTDRLNALLAAQPANTGAGQSILAHCSNPKCDYIFPLLGLMSGITWQCPKCAGRDYHVNWYVTNATVAAAPPARNEGQEREKVWAIFFEDPDIAPEIYTDAAAANVAFEHHSQKWNCTLFASIRRTPNAALSAHEPKPGREE